MSNKNGVVTTVSKQGGRKRKLGPIFVEFENGKPDPGWFQSFKPQVEYDFSDENATSTPEIKVALTSEDLTYTNMPGIAEERRQNPYSKTFLVIRNKVTKEVRLVEANSVTLSPLIKFPKTTNPFLIEEAVKNKRLERSEGTSDDPQDSRTTTKRHLTREFGQSKGRRIVEQSERLKIEDSVKHDKLMSVAETVDSSSLILPDQAAPIELTPPCNRIATQIDEVYRLSDILSEEELDILEECALTLIKQYSSPELIHKAVELKKFTDVFAGIFRRQMEVQNTRIIGAAVYMEAILQYLRLNPSKVASGPKALPSYVPFRIRQKVFDTFVPNMLVSQENNDKAFCYALVIMLIINNYCIDFKKLTSSLKIRVNHLKKLISLTGATFKVDKLSHQSFVVLRFPLAKFDPSMTMKKAKKRN